MDATSCPNYTLFKSILYTLTITFLFLILTGCPPITIKDNIPDGIPKGFIEFYYLASEEHVGIPEIYSIDIKYGAIYEGRTSLNDIVQDKVGFRLAKRPGTYKFRVDLGTAKKEVNINVLEGMVIPVRIKFGNVQKGSKGASFNMNLIIEAAVPLLKNK